MIITRIWSACAPKSGNVYLLLFEVVHCNVIEELNMKIGFLRLKITIKTYWPIVRT